MLLLLLLPAQGRWRGWLLWWEGQRRASVRGWGVEVALLHQTGAWLFSTRQRSGGKGSPPLQTRRWRWEKIKSRHTALTLKSRTYIRHELCSLNLVRAGSSDRRNILASKLCAMIFGGWEGKIVMVVLQDNVKKLRTGLFYFRSWDAILRFLGIFGNFDLNWRAKKNRTWPVLTFVYCLEEQPCQNYFI